MEGATMTLRSKTSREAASAAEWLEPRGRYRPDDRLLAFLEALCLCRHAAPVHLSTTAKNASARHNPERGIMSVMPISA
jgi:hypothetical protein